VDGQYLPAECVGIVVRLRARSLDTDLPAVPRSLADITGRSRESYQSVRSTREHNAIGRIMSPFSDGPNTDFSARHHVVADIEFAIIMQTGSTERYKATS